MWPFTSRKQIGPLVDTTGTRVAQLVERLDILEGKVRRLSDEQAELEDGIARRLDKYRKRVERDEADTEKQTVPLPALRPSPNKVVTLDPLAVRRGGRAFPGTGR